jgi:hypothetical protein
MKNSEVLQNSSMKRSILGGRLGWGERTVIRMVDFTIQSSLHRRVLTIGHTPLCGKQEKGGIKASLKVS